MLFNTEEKNMMIGAFTAGGLQALLDGYFGYKLAGGVNISSTPSDPAFWLYNNFNFWLPNLSQIIPWFGVPALMYYVGKKKRTGRLKAMGTGGLIYGVAEFIGLTAFKATAVATGQMSYRVVGLR